MINGGNNAGRSRSDEIVNGPRGALKRNRSLHQEPSLVLRFEQAKRLRLPGLSSTGIHRNDKLKGLAINVAKLCQHLDICKDGRSDRDGTSRDDKATLVSSI